MKFLNRFVLAGVCALLPFAVRPAAAQYTLTDLGTDFIPTALNNSGQILGYTQYVYPDNPQYYLVTNGNRQSLGEISGSLLNNTGQVAGVDSNHNVFLYTNGVKQILGHGNAVVSLTDNGYVAWYDGNKYSNSVHSYLYHDGVMQDLGTYLVTSANSKGQAVSAGPGTHGQTSTYLYDKGEWSLIYEVPFYIFYSYNPYRDSTPVFINDLGDIFITTSDLYTINGDVPAGIVCYSVVGHGLTASQFWDDVTGWWGGHLGDGYYYIPAFNQRGDCCGSFNLDLASAPFILGNGSYTQLFPFIIAYPTERGDQPQGSWASINNRRQAVGGGTPNANAQPEVDFLYNAATGVMTDISTLFAPLGLTNVSARRINDAGQMLVSSGADSYLATPTGTVSGTAQRQSLAANAAPQTLTFQFRDTTGYPLFTRTAAVGADGAFTLPNVDNGAYNLWVKGPKNLAKVVSVNVTNGSATGVNVVLPGGDANNDNRVDLGDFALLLGAYGSNINDGSGYYDDQTDFDGDGNVDAGDFGLLVSNYGDAGDL